MPSKLEYSNFFTSTIVPEKAPHPFNNFRGNTRSMIEAEVHNNSKQNRTVEGIYRTGSGMQRRINRQGLNAYQNTRNKSGKKKRSTRKKREESKSLFTKLEQIFLGKKLTSTVIKDHEIPFFMKRRKYEVTPRRLVIPEDIPFFQRHSIEYERPAKSVRKKGKTKKR